MQLEVFGIVIYEKNTTDPLTLCQTLLKRRKFENQNIYLQMKCFFIHFKESVQDYIYTYQKMKQN